MIVWVCHLDGHPRSTILITHPDLSLHTSHIHFSAVIKIKAWNRKRLTSEFIFLFQNQVSYNMWWTALPRPPPIIILERVTVILTVMLLHFLPCPLNWWDGTVSLYVNAIEQPCIKFVKSCNKLQVITMQSSRKMFVKSIHRRTTSDRSYTLKYDLTNTLIVLLHCNFSVNLF